jgi:hypothetical protein
MPAEHVRGQEDDGFVMQVLIGDRVDLLPER